MGRHNLRLSESSLHTLPEDSPQTSPSARTIGSSPVRTPTPNTPPPLYRQVRALPYELREHVMIYFEEGLCKEGRSLLQLQLTRTSRLPSSKLSENTPHLWGDLLCFSARHPTAFATSCFDSYSSSTSYSDYTGQDCGPDRGREPCSSILTAGAAPRRSSRRYCARRVHIPRQRKIQPP